MEEKAYRGTDVFAASKELTGCISQVINQRDNFQKEFFLLSWIKGIWGWLSKTEKKKFLKWIWLLLVGVFVSSKTQDKSGALFDTIADNLTKTTKRRTYQTTRRKTTSRRRY